MGCVRQNNNYGICPGFMAASRLHSPLLGIPQAPLQENNPRFGGRELPRFWPRGRFTESWYQASGIWDKKGWNWIIIIYTVRPTFYGTAGLHYCSMTQGSSLQFSATGPRIWNGSQKTHLYGAIACILVWNWLIKQCLAVCLWLTLIYVNISCLQCNLITTVAV